MTSWQNKTVQVRARLVPRYFWTTASIDVFLDGRCILQTGGRAKIRFSHTTTFTDNGLTYQAELSWGRSWLFRLPYQLRIDGEAVDNSTVAVENLYMMAIPALIIAGVISTLTATARFSLNRLFISPTGAVPIERSR